MRNDIDDDDDDSCSQLYGRISFCWSVILFGVITGHELSLCSRLYYCVMTYTEIIATVEFELHLIDLITSDNNNQLILPPFFHFSLIISMIVAMQQHFLSLVGLIVSLLLLLFMAADILHH